LEKPIALAGGQFAKGVQTLLTQSWQRGTLTIYLEMFLF
jgi:hypothetical protein